MPTSAHIRRSGGLARLLPYSSLSKVVLSRNGVSATFFRIASPLRPNRLSLGGKLDRMRLRRPRVYPGNRGSHTLIFLTSSAPVGVGRWAGGRAGKDRGF